MTNSLVTDWVQFESWPSVAYITLALKFLMSYSSEFLAQCHLTLSNQDLYTESQLPIILNVSLPPGLLGHPRSSHIQDLYTQVPASHHPRHKPSPGLILGHPRSSYARVPASCHPQCKPSPWTLPWAEADVTSLVLVLSPTLSAQDPYTDLRVWTQCYPNNGPIQTTVSWSLPAG